MTFDRAVALEDPPAFCKASCNGASPLSRVRNGGEHATAHSPDITTGLCVPRGPAAYRAASRPAASYLQVTPPLATLTSATNGGHGRRVGSSLLQSWRGAGELRSRSVRTVERGCARNRSRKVTHVCSSQTGFAVAGRCGQHDAQPVVAPNPLQRASPAYAGR